MPRKCAFVWSCLALGAITGAVLGDDIKSADEVIKRYVDAIGGREKLDSVKTMRLSGKAMIGGQMEAPITMELKRPNKIRMEFSLQGMTGTQAYDGKGGWFIMPFAGKFEPEQMPPDMAKQLKDQADMDGPLVDYKKKGHSVELVGTDEVEGTEAYKLKVTKEDGSVEYHFIEAEHFIPLQVKGEREVMGTKIDYKVNFGDYKEVDGLLIAHTIAQTGGEGSNTMTIEKVEINAKIPDDRFDMPKKGGSDG